MCRRHNSKEKHWWTQCWHMGSYKGCFQTSSFCLAPQLLILFKEKSFSITVVQYNTTTPGWIFEFHEDGVDGLTIPPVFPVSLGPPFAVNSCWPFLENSMCRELVSVTHGTCISPWSSPLLHSDQEPHCPDSAGKTQQNLG